MPITQRVLGLAVAIASLLAAQAFGQAKPELPFPDIPGYITLKCDLHTHTVFSDGNVWPTVRVDEARREGFDALAITDHIEYTPYKDHVNTDPTAACTVAEKSAKIANVLLVRGSEITRDTPPGHFNAIFLKDNAPLKTDGFLDAIRVANDQGAFVFWNHPAWQGHEKGKWREVHQKMYDNRWLHGVEVVNGGDYDPVAHQWCLDRGLTMLGNSDIHDPSMIEAPTPDRHRITTLAFAKERTLEGLKEALFAGRTAVWHEEQLIGREEYLRAIFTASIEIASPHYSNKKGHYCDIKNRSSIDLDLKRTGDAGPKTLLLKANASTVLHVEQSELPDDLRLQYTVRNFLIAPKQGLPVELLIQLKAPS